MSAYPILTKKNFGSAGGAEVQLVSMAKSLVDMGCKVSFITLDYGQSRITHVEPFEVLKTYRHDRVSKTWFFLKIISILTALSRSNADVYLCSADSHGILPFFAFLFRKKVVYRIPSDKVVLNNTRRFIIRLAELIDIKKANIVVSQSEFQKRKLKEIFNVDSVVIKNSLPIPNNMPRKVNPPIVLWVGSISSVKQPQLFIRLAKSIPNGLFQMIGGRAAGESHLFDQIQSLASKQKNLSFSGFIPYHKINKYFERASIFVNTSSYEGFPNTFLQAWANCIPVVSLNVDPDGLIRRKKLGFCSETFDQLILDINELLVNEVLRVSIGINSRKYVESEHSIREMTKKYAKVFNNLIKF